jgi:hypothetical protein
MASETPPPYLENQEILKFIIVQGKLSKGNGFDVVSWDARTTRLILCKECPSR